jgi:hypothetical protein
VQVFNFFKVKSMKGILVAFGFMVFVSCVQAQQNKRMLWVDKASSGKYGLVDSAKNIVVSHQYDEIKRLVGENECFRTKLNGKYGLLDRFGNKAISPNYDEITLRTQAAEWIETKLNGKFGFADFWWSKQNNRYEIKEVFQPKYDDTFYSAGESIGSGYIKVKLNNKWGLVDELTGREITGMKYDEVNDFYFYQGHKWTEVMVNNKYGLIDKTGKEVIPCVYDKLISIDFKNERILVKQDGREFYLDKSGKK